MSLRPFLIALAFLAPACAHRQRCCSAPPCAGPVIPLETTPETAPPARPNLTLTVMVNGRYEEQPGFLTIGWPDSLVGYNLQDDTRAVSFRMIDQRLEALQKSTPGPSVRLILHADPERHPRPHEFAEVQEHLRAAGYTQIDVTYESLEGVPLSWP